MARRYTCLYTLIVCASPLLGQYDYAGFPTDPGYDFRRSNQQQTISIPLQGRLELPDNVEPTRLRVLLLDSARRAIVAETYCSFNGSFDFHSVPSGIYELQVRNLNGEVVHQTSVSLPTATSLIIKLTNRTQNISGRSVSAKRLAHKIPKDARKDYEKAREQLISGKNKDIEERLTRAVQADPEFFEALSALGAVYLQSGRFQQSIAILNSAMAIDDHDSAACSNLALAYLQVHKLSEAEDAARHSIDANALNPRARFFLAISLLEQGKAHQEAVYQLKQARDAFPPAKHLLTRLEVEWKGTASAKLLDNSAASSASTSPSSLALSQ
jgi:tetratricopeptide (TPR) repeat protein